MVNQIIVMIKTSDFVHKLRLVVIECAGYIFLAVVFAAIIAIRSTKRCESNEYNLRRKLFFFNHFFHGFSRCF